MKVLRFPLVRLVIAISIFMLGNALAAFLLSWLEQLINPQAFDSWVQPLAGMLFHSGFALLGYWIFVSLFDGRPMTELNQKIGKNNLIGIILGFSFISLIIGVMAILGYYRIDGLTNNPALFSLFSMSVVAGIVEEIGLRGYFFRIVEEGLGTWLAVVISALLFGFLHAWNPNASLVSSISIALTAGVVLALLYVLTRNLWIVIAMHFAWNFTLGGIWGAPVSGGDANGLLNGVFEGPDLLTGGDFGPEASMITVIVFTVFAIYLIKRTIRENKVVKPLWSMNK